MVMKLKKQCLYCQDSRGGGRIPANLFSDKTLCNKHLQEKRKIVIRKTEAMYDVYRERERQLKQAAVDKLLLPVLKSIL